VAETREQNLSGNKLRKTGDALFDARHTDENHSGGDVEVFELAEKVGAGHQRDAHQNRVTIAPSCGLASSPRLRSSSSESDGLRGFVDLQTAETPFKVSAVFAAIKAVSKEPGAFLAVKNYSGDWLN
jgi:hypothetical protein